VSYLIIYHIIPLEEREHWEHLGVEGMVYIAVVRDLGWDMEWINLRSWLFFYITCRRLIVFLRIRTGGSHV